MSLYRRFHDRFGTVGVVLGVIALIAALSGTALAAKGAFTPKQKKEIEKIAKKFQGTGPAGPPGTNGTNGTNGKDGTNGTNGESVVLAAAGSCPNGGTKVTVGGVSKEVCNGTDGTDGTNGTDGTSVTSTHLEPGEGGCTEGGTEFTSASGTETVCNGEEGPAGPITAVAPSGLLMTGTSSFNSAPKGPNEGTDTDPAGNVIARPNLSISFPYRLPGGFAEMENILEEKNGYKFEFLSNFNHTTNCPGNMFEPASAPKILCMWVNGGNWTNVSIPPAVNGATFTYQGLSFQFGLQSETQPAGGALTWSYRVP